MDDNNSLNDSVNDKVNDNGVLNDKMDDNSLLNDNMNDNMNDNVERKAILDYLNNRGEISVTMAAKIIERSHSTARRELLKLAEAGIVVPSGANRNRKYVVVLHIE